MASKHLPVIDFSRYGLEVERGTLDEEKLTILGKELVDAFTNHGFTYIINHGFPSQLMNQLNKMCEEFFSLPLGTKKKYQKLMSNQPHGYTAPETENVNKDRPAGLHEAFCMCPLAEVYPDQEVPALRPTVHEFCQQSQELLYRILEPLALASGFKKDYFTEGQNILTRPNCGVLRCNNYLPVLEGKELKENQIWLGEHQDFGTVALLFQDSVAGLEVLDTKGMWVSVPPLDGGIVLITGLIMQRYTNDKIKAGLHRVVISDKAIKEHQYRRSYVFFGIPDNDVIIPAGKDQEEVSALDYCKKLAENISLS